MQSVTRFPICNILSIHLGEKQGTQASLPISFSGLTAYYRHQSFLASALSAKNVYSAGNDFQIYHQEFNEFLAFNQHFRISNNTRISKRLGQH